MKHIVTYSMGISSAWIAVHLKNQGLEPICVFSDTKQEDEDTYRFGFEVAKLWDLNLVEASDGRSLYELFKAENFIPARQISTCSRLLKIGPRERFINEIAEPSAVHYGYDTNEADRAEKLQEQWRHPVHIPRFILIELGLGKSQCFSDFLRWGVKPPRIYAHFNHANCLPCKNFKLPDWIALRAYYPDRFAAAQRLEDEDGLKWMQDGPYLRDLPETPPSWKRRHAREVYQPAFSVDMTCGACATD